MTQKLVQVARPIPILIPRPKKCPNRDRYWYHSPWYRCFRYDTDIPVCLWSLMRGVTSKKKLCTAMQLFLIEAVTAAFCLHRIGTVMKIQYREKCIITIQRPGQWRGIHRNCLNQAALHHLQSPTKKEKKPHSAKQKPTLTARQLIINHPETYPLSETALKGRTTLTLALHIMMTCPIFESRMRVWNLRSRFVMTCGKSSRAGILPQT